MLGNTRVNTLRLAWTQEDVAFANPCFNGNGRDQAACAPTLTFQTFIDQQSDVAQARVNDAYQLEDTMSWFIPGRRGDHDIKVGVQLQYSQSRQRHAGQPERDVHFRPEQRSVRSGGSAHLSRSLLDPRARAPAAASTSRSRSRRSSRTSGS